MANAGEHDYVLGTHDDEIARLRLQHDVWRSSILDLWRRAGISAGQTVVDLGCGPGFASLDLAAMVGPGGRIISIDRSARYLAALRTEAADRHLNQIESFQIDLNEKFSWPVDAVDCIWDRWALAFVSDPRQVLTSATALLRPGGCFVVQEYLAYETWQLLPRSSSFETFVSAVMRSWRDAGGESNIAGSLAGWLQELGFTIEHCQPLIEAVSAADPLWQWCRAFAEVGPRRLADLGFLTDIEASDAWRDFLTAEAAPGTLMVTPLVLQIIARKP